MAKFIATFNDTIEDIEINGFTVLTDKEVEEYEDLAYSITWPFTFKMGEYELEFSNGEDLLGRIDFKEISFEDSKSLKKLFNNEFGFFIGFDFLESIVEEEDDYDGDDDDEFDEDGYDGYGSNFYDDDEFDDNY
jgi:hypothetical protein